MDKIHLGFSHGHASSPPDHFHLFPRVDSALHTRSCWTSEPASLTGGNVYPNAFCALSHGHYQRAQRLEALTWIEFLDRSRCANGSRRRAIHQAE